MPNKRIVKGSRIHSVYDCRQLGTVVGFKRIKKHGIVTFAPIIEYDGAEHERVVDSKCELASKKYQSSKRK